MAASAKRPRSASGDRPRTSLPGSTQASPARKPPGEFELLAKVRAAVDKLGRGRGVRVGIGDDCAVVHSPRDGKPLVLTTDTLVEDVHFHAGWLTPRELGVRAFRAAVSDIASMGARPRYVLLSLEIPGDRHGFGAREALALVRSLASDARRCGAALVGGNVSGGARTGVTVTVVGEAAGKPLLRSAARIGDLVFVTGRLGGSAAGWRTLLESAAGRRPRDDGERGHRAATAAYRKPPLRLDFAAALAERGFANAMIDLSDGLLQDLGHVAQASRVAIRVDAAAVPVHPAAIRFASSQAPKARSARAAHSRAAMPSAVELALTGGEDYELAFTAPAARLAAIEKLAARLRTPLHAIGRIEKIAGGRAAVTDSAGRPFAVSAEGFDHLRGRGAKATVRGRSATNRATNGATNRAMKPVPKPSTR